MGVGHRVAAHVGDVGHFLALEQLARHAREPGLVVRIDLEGGREVVDRAHFVVEFRNHGLLEIVQQIQGVALAHSAHLSIDEGAQGAYQRNDDQRETGEADHGRHIAASHCASSSPNTKYPSLPCCLTRYRALSACPKSASASETRSHTAAPMLQCTETTASPTWMST